MNNSKHITLTSIGILLIAGSVYYGIINREEGLRLGMLLAAALGIFLQYPALKCLSAKYIGGRGTLGTPVSVTNLLSGSDYEYYTDCFMHGHLYASIAGFILVIIAGLVFEDTQISSPAFSRFGIGAVLSVLISATMCAVSRLIIYVFLDNGKASPHNCDGCDDGGGDGEDVKPPRPTMPQSLPEGPGGLRLPSAENDGIVHVGISDDLLRRLEEKELTRKQS